ncbi:MAG: aldose 1-epimerase family protein, partial [Lachnospiraceae bacterium]|nr:aldose 1-epimerase family protein [Lachnospiraceae bacterium]
MEHILENEKLKVTVSDHGAEIRSVIRKSDGTELMWQADPAYWGRTSPVLFPLVGNYFEKKSVYDGKTYEMGQHGFARDMDFTLIKETKDGLVFELKDNEASHEKYPFDFELVIGYVLTDLTIKVSWTVRNTNDSKMYFSIGAHPAFNCDLNSYSLYFEKAGKPVSELLANVIANDGSGCLSEETDRHKLNNGVLKLSDELFFKDALIMEGEQSDRVTLRDDNGNDIVTVTCPTKLFGVWSPVKKQAPFVCIEPWYGRCDRVGFNQKL